MRKFVQNCGSLVLLITLASGPGAWSQVSVSGLADRTVYPETVTFTVNPLAGYDLAANLDAAPVPIGAPVLEREVNYHELEVWATNQSTEQVTSQRFRFNVVATEREGTENGLPPWTPLPPIPSAFEETSGGELRILCPAAFPVDLQLPVVARVLGPNGEALRVNGSVRGPGAAAFNVLRGWGSGFVSPATSGNLEFVLNQLRAEKPILWESNINWTPVAGTVSGATLWPGGSRIAVNGDLVIGPEATLEVGAGSVLRLAAGARIHVLGKVHLRGTDQEPVTLVPALRTQPWGGIYLTNSGSVLEATATIFTGSGANPNGVPESHRHEECLFFLDQHAHLRLTNCAALYLAGQFGHSVDRGQPWNSVTIVDSLIQGGTTGGEWNGASILLLRSAILEMPAGRNGFSNGDEDGIYFTTGRFEVLDSLVGWTGDDGIDAGSGGASSVLVSNTWVEATFHEAFAWSGGNRLATNLSCVVINCGQGIECGWSSSADSPIVLARDCLVTANAVGARFGDNYDWTYNGQLLVTNSLLLNNHRDVWGMNWDDWTYRTNQMDVRGNCLTVRNPLHPENAVWQPLADRARLLPFMTIMPSATVGIGFALHSAQLDLDRLKDLVPVRLSHFTTNLVSVRCVLQDPNGVVTNWALEFLPGETVKAVPGMSAPAGTSLLRLALAEPSGVELTGITNAWFVARSTDSSVLVPAGSVWKFNDSGTNADSRWKEMDFDDSGWPAGPAELGYGDSKDGRAEATQLGFGSDAANKHLAYYFRHTFTNAAPLPAALRVQLKRDDGAAVYLNGAEVYRSNLPEGPVTPSTRALLASDDGTVFYSKEVPGTFLSPGRNVLAVEVHQESAGSSDLSFDLQLEAQAPLRLESCRFGGEWFLVWDEGTSELLFGKTTSGPWSPLTATSPLNLSTSSAPGFYRLRQY